jgi:hypothetical protein
MCRVSGTGKRIFQLPLTRHNFLAQRLAAQVMKPLQSHPS